MALALAVGAAVAQTVLFEDDFTGEALSDQWALWGTIEPFNRIEVFDGNLEFEGSVGFEAFGVFAAPQLDLTQGPITIVVELTRMSSNEGSEIAVWFINQYMVDDDPWTQGDFIRVVFNSSGNRIVVQKTSPELRGMGTVLADIENAFEMGQRHVLEFTLDETTYTVVLDGVELASGEHGLPELTGYLHIHDWNSLEGDIDLIHRVAILQN